VEKLKFFKNTIGLWHILMNYQEQQGMFKKVRSARPQALWRAEGTGEYVSTTKGRERR